MNPNTQKSYAGPIIGAIVVIVIIIAIIWAAAAHNGSTGSMASSTDMSGMDMGSSTGADMNGSDMNGMQNGMNGASTGMAGSALWLTYTSTSTGLTFQYPSTWTLKQSADKNSVTVSSDATSSLGGTNVIPSLSVSFVASSTSSFGEQLTKYGDIKYSAPLGALVDGSVSPQRCLAASYRLGVLAGASTTIPVVAYSGSMMSSPAYMDSAIFTTKGQLILVEEQSDARVPNDSQFFKSIGFAGGTQAQVPQCASASVTK